MFDNVIKDIFFYKTKRNTTIKYNSKKTCSILSIFNFTKIKVKFLYLSNSFYIHLHDLLKKMVTLPFVL